MPEQTRIFAFAGLIASGKSTLAKAWADSLGAAYYNSDEVRKELAGLVKQAEQKDSFNQGIYTPEFSEKTYNALLERAAQELAAGKKVVLDASYQNPKDRYQVKELAVQSNTKSLFILCHCPEELMKERMEIRAQDPTAVSDGRWEIYLQQKERFKHPDELDDSELVTIATDKPVADLVKQLSELIASV